MEMKCTQEQALHYLENLVGQPLRYGLKSYDMDLYDFGFGEELETTNCWGETRSVNLHNLHILCNFKVIYKAKKGHKTYYGNTHKKEFELDIQDIVGLSVKRVALSDKNDLWLDFGDYWVVFTTNEDAEESWRYFITGKENPHLVVADTWLEFN